MIRLKITLLLAIGLLAPLHSAGAPACGGAGGEDYAAPAASTRRGVPSASEVMVENDWLRMCNEKQKTLEMQFPGILTGAIPSEPQPITEAQLTALNDARKAIVDATNNINEGSMPDYIRTLDAYGKLVDDVVKALLQVKMPRSGFDIAALASQLDTYNTVQKRRVPKLHDTLEIDGDLNYSFSANQLKKYIASPAIAQYAERTSLPEPADNDAPAERLASLRLEPVAAACCAAEETETIATERLTDIEILNQIEIALINEHHAPFRRAFAEAQTALRKIPAEQNLLTCARELLAKIDKDDLLKRMALCFVWFLNVPHADNLDKKIKLRKIITKERFFLEYTLNFASIKALPRCEAITQLIIDFVLSLLRPASLSIDEPSGAVTVVSDQLTLLLLNENALLNTLDVSNCTKLVMLFLAPRCDRLTNVMLNPNLNAFSREEIEGIVAANRARIAAEQARGNGCFGCAIQ